MDNQHNTENALMRHKLWEKYKVFYDKISEAETKNAVNRLSDQSDSLMDSMSDKIPEFADIISDLSMLLTSKINGRMRGVTGKRGKRPRPNYILRLRIVIQRLEIQNLLMVAFLERNIIDPWIDSRIFADMKHSKMESLSYIEYLDEEVAEGITSLSEDDKASIVRAEQIIAEAKAVIRRVNKAKKLRDVGTGKIN